MSRPRRGNKSKQFYAINVQAVCDSAAFNTNIVARWPGSTHDLRILENSNISDKLRNGALDGILVGDSGRACQAFLITPVLKSKNAGEVRYNTVHCHSRFATQSRDGSKIFLGGGAPLRNGVTNTYKPHFFAEYQLY